MQKHARCLRCCATSLQDSSILQTPTCTCQGDSPAFLFLWPLQFFCFSELYYLRSLMQVDTHSSCLCYQWLVSHLTHKVHPCHCTRKDCFPLIHNTHSVCLPPVSFPSLRRETGAPPPSGYRGLHNHERRCVNMSLRSSF